MTFEDVARAWGGKFEERHKQGIDRGTKATRLTYDM